MLIFGLPNLLGHPASQKSAAKPQNPRQGREQEVRSSHQGEAKKSFEAFRSQQSGADGRSGEAPRKNGSHVRLKCREGIVGRRIGPRADYTAAHETVESTRRPIKDPRSCRARRHPR